MADTYNKKEREKKKARRRKEKELKRAEKRETETSSSLEAMMAYVDENGILRDTPQDPKMKKSTNLEDIQLGVPQVEKDDFNPIMEGAISFFEEKKGYGFIKTPDNENLFVHFSDITGNPIQGKKVKFEKEKGPKGWVAVRVTIL